MARTRRGGPNRREFLAGATVAAAGFALPVHAGGRFDAVIFVVSERGLPAADLVAGQAPRVATAAAPRDGWGGAARRAVAAPARAAFEGRLSVALPRLAARGDVALRADLRAAADDWFGALAALALGAHGRVVDGAELAGRCRAAEGARARGERALVVAERADWSRPGGFERRAAALDGALAELLAGLARSGHADDTLVVVCSAVGRAPHGRVHGWRDEARGGALALAVGPGADDALAARTTLELRDRTLGRIAPARGALSWVR